MSHPEGSASPPREAFHGEVGASPSPATPGLAREKQHLLAVLRRDRPEPFQPLETGNLHPQRSTSLVVDHIFDRDDCSATLSLLLPDHPAFKNLSGSSEHLVETYALEVSALVLSALLKSALVASAQEMSSLEASSCTTPSAESALSLVAASLMNFSFMVSSSAMSAPQHLSPESPPQFL